MKNPTNPPRLARAESFLGFHFDFHAGPDSTGIGKRTTPEMIERIIREAHPDYLQCDCKGHPGISSYPTRVGNPAPGIVGDPLRVWRDVTAAHGVALYMHYSGVWDHEALRQHPSWARIDEKGHRDPNNTSVFGPYADRLLIPQLVELAEEYGVDGVWVDGECWATAQDYGKRVLQAFREATGIETVPRKPEDPGFHEFTEFCREGFRSYLRHWVDEVHRASPDFQIASNWAFTSFMPEPVSANVDFLSGDYTSADSVNSARLEGRCLARQGKPWDLMAWSFSSKWEEAAWSTKSAVQLQREAAVILALGGGFQAYFRQDRDGAIFDWQVKLMAEVAAFCRARQPYCHQAEAVPQIGLLLSTPSFYRKTHRLFSPWGGEMSAIRGTLQCLLDSQYPVEVLMEHQLTGRMQEYPLLVVPEWDDLEQGLVDDLREYVRQGGALLLIGPGAARLFEAELKVRLVGDPKEEQRWLECAGWLGVVKCACQEAELLPGSERLSTLHEKDDLRSPSIPAASITEFGRGKIGAIYANLGGRYASAATFVQRDFLSALTRRLFPRPLVQVTGSHLVDVTVNRIGGRLAINLVNTAGPHADPKVYSFDEIPPVGPLTIRVRLPEPPERVILQPGDRAVDWIYEDGEVKLTLERLEVHDIVVI